MEIQGEKVLGVSREAVWRALNDPTVLQRCLAGCDTFEAEGENRYRVAMQASVGPIRARFAGKLQLLDIVAPTSYALSFEGSGGVAGFGKGTARVTLRDMPQGTCLQYVAQAQVGGRLAQVGERLIDGVTRRMADDFFSRFAKELAAQDPSESAVAPPKQAAEPPAAAPTCAVVNPLNCATPQPAPSTGTSAQVAVLAASIAATAAAVASLAAVIAVLLGR